MANQTINMWDNIFKLHDHFVTKQTLCLFKHIPRVRSSDIDLKAIISSSLDLIWNSPHMQQTFNLIADPTHASRAIHIIQDLLSGKAVRSDIPCVLLQILVDSAVLSVLAFLPLDLSTVIYDYAESVRTRLLFALDVD
jgi:hypothetical protein